LHNYQSWRVDEIINIYSYILHEIVVSNLSQHKNRYTIGLLAVQIFYMYIF